MSFKNLTTTPLAALVLSMLSLPAAQATLLAPGGTVAAAVVSPSGLIIADTGVQSFVSSPVGAFSGKFEGIVIQDATNPFGAGDLTFIYEVTNDAASRDALETVSMTNFAGFLTDVGYATCCSISGAIGTIAPSTVTRGAGTGATVTFDFAGNTFLPGTKAFDLVIRTNAHTFQPGQVNFIDGGIAQLNAFAPAPEPAQAGLLLGGLFAAGLFVTRKFRAAKQV